MQHNSIVNSNTTHNPHLRVVFHDDELDIEPFRIESLDITVNYLENITEFIILNVLLTDDIYSKHVIKNKNGLRCTLIYNNIFNYKREFIALPYLDVVDDNTSYNDSQHQFSKVQFQLIQYDLKNLYQGVVNGIFKSVSEMVNILSKVEIEKGKFNLIEEPHNTRVYKQYVLKPTKPNELLDTLQKTVGVFNSNPTMFYSVFDNTLSVYPMYSLTESKQPTFILTVGNNVMYEDLKSTYAYDNNNQDTIRVLVNDFRFNNKRDAISKTLPNHFDAVDTDTLYDRPMGNITRRGVADETAMYGNYVGNTNNLYKFRALSAKGQGRIATCKWNRSNGLLLKPMSNVKVEFNNSVYIGKVIGYHTFYDRGHDSETTLIHMFLKHTKE